MGDIVNQLVGKTVYLDTNIFIYAVEEPTSVSQYSGFIKELFKYIDNGEITAITSELTLAEILVGTYTESPELIGIYDELITDSDFLQVFCVDREILKQSALLRSQRKISLADAIHVATAIQNNAHIIITNDKKMQVPNDMEKLTLSDF